MRITVKSVVRVICFSLLHRLVTFFAWLHILVLVPFTSVVRIRFIFTFYHLVLDTFYIHFLDHLVSCNVHVYI